MITKRKLLTWRSEALKELQRLALQEQTRMAPIHPLKISTERILVLTQELIDRYLIKES